MFTNFFPTGHFVKIAWRNLWKNKIFSFINIAGLSMGLACTMLIILYTKDELSYDRFHENGDNIYRIVNDWYNPDSSFGHSDGNTGDIHGAQFAGQIPEYNSIVRIQGDSRDIRKANEITNYEMLAADSNFFTVFSFPLIAGNPSTCLADPKSIVLSEDMASKFFNSNDIVGKTLEIKGDTDFELYTISGVSKRCPQNSSIKFDFILKKNVNPADYQNKENWFNFFLNTFAVLTPGADTKTVEAKMKQVYESETGEVREKMMTEYGVNELPVYVLQPLTEMHLSTKYIASNGLSDDSNPIYSYILSSIALFILLIACINFINLAVARSLKRAKEIGVRKAIGSSKSQLIGQFMGESFLICLFAFSLGFLIALLVLPVFNQLSNKVLSFNYLLNAKLISIYIGVFLLTAFIAGFYPALLMSNFNPVDTLYGKLRLAGKFLLQKSLVVVQFGLASFLIIATLVMYQQFKYLTSKDLGYDDKNVVLVNSWNMPKEKSSLFKTELLKNPIIESVGMKNGGFWGSVVKVNGDKQINMKYETIDEDFIPLFKLELLKGRNFSKDFPSDSSRSVIVNEAFVKEAQWENPLNQIVDFWYNNEKYTVIGVIKDYHFAALNQPIKPQLFTMRPRNAYGMANIKIKAGSEQASLQLIANTYKSIFPVNAYTYQFLDQVNKNKYASEAKWKRIILYSSIMTIFISCIGLFGLANLTTERRVKEIGVRKVLGASVVNIVRLLSKDFLLLVCISLVFSFPAALFAANKWLASYPYRIDITGWIFVFTLIITVGITLFTIGWDAIKAAIANPVKSLRSE